MHITGSLKNIGRAIDKLSANRLIGQKNSLETKSSKLLMKILGTLFHLHAVEVDTSAMEEHMLKLHPYKEKEL